LKMELIIESTGTIWDASGERSDLIALIADPRRCFYEGNRMLWESEDQLRQYLTADGVVYDESDLSATLTKLETAAVPGYDCRLVRGNELHRRQTPGVRWKMPARAILLEQLHPFDVKTYEPCDIEPYVIPPPGA
jgi:hypothetical protein